MMACDGQDGLGPQTRRGSARHQRSTPAAGEARVGARICLATGISLGCFVSANLEEGFLTLVGHTGEQMGSGVLT
jgi:hypothetical protein